MKNYHNAEVAWLGLGSNLGDKVTTLQQAALDLSVLPQSSLLAVSSIYVSPPVGTGYSGNFHNAVIGLLTGLTPFELLAQCMFIENEYGRDRQYSDRTLDIDILLYGKEIISTKDLMIPHPEMAHRRFVLEPLVEIAPDVVHPTEHLEIRRLLEDKCWNQPIRRLDQPLIPAWGC